MNKRELIRWGMALIIGLMLTGCAGYGGYRNNGGYISDNPHPSYSCPSDYGVQYCARY